MGLEVIAHRGMSDAFPENTIPSFEAAVALGADGIELDVRLTSDRVPVVYHYFYLTEVSGVGGAIFEQSLDLIRTISLEGATETGRIPTLAEVLETFAGRTTLEIELKGPEPEAASVVAAVLRDFRQHWMKMEITSYEPTLLREIRRLCDIPVDLLTHKSEPWMHDDVVAFTAINRAKMAEARAVHLHPSQLTQQVVSDVRRAGVEIHSWEVNDEPSRQLMRDFEIPRFTTDRLAETLEWRNSH